MNRFFIHSRNYFIRYVVLLAIMFIMVTPRGESALVPIYGYEDFLNAFGVQTIQSEVDLVEWVPDNMTWINPTTGEEEVISGTWDILFLRDSVGGGLEAIGGMENRYGNGEYPGFEGWLDGIYVRQNQDGSYVMSIGERPQYVWAFHDVNQDGYGFFDTATAQWNMGSDDVLYDQNNIEFNGVLGDVNELPVLGGMGTLYVPHMTVVGSSVIPEPTTMLLLGIGLMMAAFLKGKKCNVITKAIEIKLTKEF